MLNKLTVKEMKAMAKDAKVKGYTKLKKNELLRELRVTKKYGLILDYMEDYGVSLEVAEDMASND